MNYGCILTGPPSDIVELSQEAEHAGWDGVFLPDDWMTAWITLTAIAMRTHRIHLGTMLTPLPEQLPWYVAAQTATLDQLSQSRVILTAGLGAAGASSLPLDIMTEGQTPSDDHVRATAIVRPYAEAGATWWLESRWEGVTGTSDMRTRIRSGPPRLS